MKSKLEAINKMLNAINEDNVKTDLELAEHLQGELAEETLNRVKRNILSEGWDLNTDDAWVFSPEQSGTIPIPMNVLDLSSSDGRYFMRDWRMYDKVDKTFNFSLDTKIECRVVWDLDFDDLTHPMARYIAIVAAREFQMTIIGDETIDTKMEKEENKSRIVLAESEDLTGQHNMLRDNRMSASFMLAQGVI